MFPKKTIIILFGVILVILFLLFGISFDTYEIQGDVHSKQGILQDVVRQDNNIIIGLTDGETITCKEDNREDAVEMVEYLTGWIGDEIYFEYTQYPGDDFYTITAVEGV